MDCRASLWQTKNWNNIFNYRYVTYPQITERRKQELVIDKFIERNRWRMQCHFWWNDWTSDKTWESVSIISQYKVIVKAEKKKDYAYVLKQGYILKKFKNTEQFFETLGLSKCTVYFKINLYKLIKKYPHLKNPHLSVQYFKNNFKMMKLVCKENGNEFRLKD